MDVVSSLKCSQKRWTDYCKAYRSQTCQVDLSTRHKALTNALGFASFEDPEGPEAVSCRFISVFFFLFSTKRTMHPCVRDDVQLP